MENAALELPSFRRAGLLQEGMGGWSGEQRHCRQRNSLSKGVALAEGRTRLGNGKSSTVTEASERLARADCGRP